MFAQTNKPNNDEHPEKKHDFKVQFFVKASKKPGIVKIFCYVSLYKKRTATPFSTGVQLKKRCWDNKAKTIKCSGYETEAYLLDTIKTEITEIYIRLKNERDYFDAEDIKKIYLSGGGQQKTVLELYERWIQDQEKEIGTTIVKATWVKYHNKRDNLIAYLESISEINIKPHEVDIHFAQKFGNYLKRVQKMKHNSAMRSVQQLSRVLEWGIQERYIKENRMKYFKYNFDTPEAPVYLTPEQLEDFMRFRFKSESLQRVADCFILQCWTSMDYADIITFNKAEHLKFQDGTWYIVKKRAKAAMGSSGQVMQCPLNVHSKRIWEKYGWQPPIWSDRHNKCMSGDKYRKYLKECAEIVGIDVNIVTKTGRKTFINLMHQQGLDAEDIAQMVGHNNIKTTYKFYIKFSPKRITMSVQKAFGKEFLVG